MKYSTKKVVIDIMYLLGITTACFALGWQWGQKDTAEEISDRLKEAAANGEEDYADHGRYEWAPGGEEAYAEALEEADKDEPEEEKEAEE